MGGGGFMQHALSTNRKDREQRANRRKKFKGDHNEQMLQNYDGGNPLEFPVIPEEQILQERKRIKETHQKRRRINAVIISVALVLVITGVYALYIKTGGFENW